MVNVESLYLKRLLLSLALLILILLAGIIGFILVEKLSLLDAVYLAVVTIFTIGYGDIVPHTPIGKIFTIFFITMGVGTAYYTFGLIVSMTIEGQIKDIFGRKGMELRIANLTNHIIVCGAGKVGANVIEHLHHANQQFVAVEKDQEVYERLLKQKMLAVFGDATLDEVLLTAGLRRARGVITALSSDADNVYVTLTAKSLNPQITIVARADRPEAKEKLLRAGVDTVIFPAVMGGRQLVSAMIKPVIMDFVENLFYNQDLHMDIAEITIMATSPLVGTSLEKSSIKDKFNSIVVAIKRGNEIITNPRADEVIQGNDIMIVLGQPGSLSELNDIASH